jgi:hypothetical protein
MTLSRRQLDFRMKLAKEFAATPSTEPRRHKQSVGSCKKISPRSKFLQKPQNKPEPGDIITSMPAMNRKPKGERL